MGQILKGVECKCVGSGAINRLGGGGTLKKLPLRRSKHRVSVQSRGVPGWMSLGAWTELDKPNLHPLQGYTPPLSYSSFLFLDIYIYYTCYSSKLMLLWHQLLRSQRPKVPGIASNPRKSEQFPWEPNQQSSNFS